MISIRSNSIKILRIASSLIFIVAGLGHVVAPAKMIKKLSQTPIGEWLLSFNLVHDLVFLTGFPLILFGVAFMCGYKTKLAAIALLILLIPITISAQVGSSELVGALFKNIALTGVLYFFISNDFQKKLT